MGPSIITVRGSSLDPFLRSGDVVLVRRGTDGIHRGSIVFTEAPLRTGSLLQRVYLRLRYRDAEQRPPMPVGRPVARIVAGLPGETVVWNDRRVLIGAEQYDLTLLHEDLPHPDVTVTLGPDEFFLVAHQPGRADSRIIGPVERRGIRFRVQTILLPAERRGAVGNVLPERTDSGR